MFNVFYKEFHSITIKEKQSHISVEKMPHYEQRTWGDKQRFEYAEAEKIRAEQAAKIQHDLDTYGTTSTYYGRSNRESLSYRFYQRQTK